MSPARQTMWSGEYCEYLVLIMWSSNLVPRPLPDFISQPWRKIGRRPGIKTASWTGNGGLGLCVTWTRFVLTESTISGPWRSYDPRPPDFSPRLRDKIWEWPGDEASDLPPVMCKPEFGLRTLRFGVQTVFGQRTLTFGVQIVSSICEHLC